MKCIAKKKITTANASAAASLWRDELRIDANKEKIHRLHRLCWRSSTAWLDERFLLLRSFKPTALPDLKPKSAYICVNLRLPSVWFNRVKMPSASKRPSAIPVSTLFASIRSSSRQSEAAADAFAVSFSAHSPSSAASWLQFRFGERFHLRFGCGVERGRLDVLLNETTGCSSGPTKSMAGQRHDRR